MNSYQDYISALKLSLHENTFVKFSLGKYKGTTENLKNCYVKKIQIKHEDKLSVTYRYQTKDIVKNYSIEEGISLINDFLEHNDFRQSTLFTVEFNLAFEHQFNNNISIKKTQATQTQLLPLQHNVEKKRLIIAEGSTYLHQLKITDEKGHVIHSAQDKYKQINHYIDILSPLIKSLPQKDLLSVVDMGSGKGYLTFALYDYLMNALKLKSVVTGVEYRKDMVELCNDIAKKSSFNDLHFVQGSIKDFDVKETNVLIALHACDTATDDAIFKGITTHADLIVVAPCCHKQIRRELEKYKTKNNLDFLIKHGIFLERHAEMLTDGLRSLILEYCGYATKVFEFISGEHTAKNVMIVAEKKTKTSEQKLEILSKIKEAKLYFGIESHYLEKLMEI